MKRFRFQLESLLRVRRSEEERAGRAVAELVRARLELEERIRRARENLAEGQEELRIAATGHVDLLTLQVQGRAAVEVMRMADRFRPALAVLDGRLEQTRALLNACARRRRSIELLRERRYSEWRTDGRRVDQAALDDLVQQRREEIG